MCYNLTVTLTLFIATSLVPNVYVPYNLFSILLYLNCTMSNDL